MALLDEVEEAVGRVAAAVGPSVVRIGRGPGRGSGFVVGDGAVLTNAHNLRGGETTVTFADGRDATGTVAGVDADNDLAVLHVPTAGAAALDWRDAEVGLGAVVFAVTCTHGGSARVTLGTVSSSGRPFRGPRGRLVRGGLEHTAPLIRGSSRSPVVDAAGKLVGINTHRLGDGFYLAIPADADLRSLVADLTRGESPSRRYLGVALLPSRAGRRLRAAVGLPEREGLLVRDVDANGPAARAGVRAGDLLVEAAGRALDSHDVLYDVLASLERGGSLHLRLLRGAEEVDVQVVFGHDDDAGGRRRTDTGADPGMRRRRGPPRGRGRGDLRGA